MADTFDTYRTVTAYLIVSDADAELRFLTAAFGAIEKSCHRDESGRVMHAEFTIGDTLVMLGQASEQWKPLSAAFYLWVRDVDGTYANALAAGARSERAPEDMPYGHRNAGVIDLSGQTWWIAAPSVA
jgi:PhnB protein